MLYQAAVSAMSILAQMGTAGHLEHLGVSRGDFDRLVSSIPWLAQDRNRMTVTLTTLMLGSIDAQGLPRYQVYAELRSAAIAMFVHPVNISAACVYMETSPDMESLQVKSDANNLNKTNHVHADQIRAMVDDLLRSDARSSARLLFERNTGLALDLVKKEGKK